MHVLPCCFDARIGDFTVGPHQAWNRAENDRYPCDQYYFYVARGTFFGRSTSLAGAYWSGFVKSYNIRRRDVVTFTYNAASRCFVLEVTNGDNIVVKPWVQEPRMHRRPGMH